MNLPKDLTKDIITRLKSIELYEENAVTPEQIKEAINEIEFKAGIPVTEKRNE